jgi:hypothetical protein
VRLTNTPLACHCLLQVAGLWYILAMATGATCLLLLLRAFHKHPEVLRDLRKRISSRKRLVVAPAPDTAPAPDAPSAAANAAEQGQGPVMTLESARRNPCVTSRGGAPVPDSQAGAAAPPAAQAGVTAEQDDGLVFYEETPRSPMAAR